MDHWVSVDGELETTRTDIVEMAKRLRNSYGQLVKLADRFSHAAGCIAGFAGITHLFFREARVVIGPVDIVALGHYVMKQVLARDVWQNALTARRVCRRERSMWSHLLDEVEYWAVEQQRGDTGGKGLHVRQAAKRRHG